MSRQYYLLNEPFCLRGYEKLPYGLLHRPDNSIGFVAKRPWVRIPSLRLQKER